MIGERKAKKSNELTTYKFMTASVCYISHISRTYNLFVLQWFHRSRSLPCLPPSTELWLGVLESAWKCFGVLEVLGYRRRPTSFDRVLPSCFL